MKQLMKYSIALMLAMVSLLCSCNKELESVEYRTIHYIATARDIGTRATLNEGLYVFEASDRLYISATGADEGKLYGFLVLVSGAGTTSATFEGDLTCADDFDPGANIVATLVGSADAIHNCSNGRLGTLSYPTSGSAGSLAEAVQKYSDFKTAEVPFGTENFTFYQHSAFLEFTITFMNIVAANKTVSYTVSNGEGGTSFASRTGTVTTADVGGKVKASFVLAFPGGTSLNNATITVAKEGEGAFSRDRSISNATLANNRYYSVAKTISDIDFDGLTVEAVNANTTVTFNKYNVEYSTDGSSWQTLTAGSSVQISSAGGRLFFRQNAATNAHYNNGSDTTPILLFDKDCYVYGNMMSLLSTVSNGEYSHGTSFNGVEHVFQGFFYGNTHLKTHPDWEGDPLVRLLLPVTTLTPYCYYEMFYGCSALEKAPDLPAVNPEVGCYFNIFRNCSILNYIKCLIVIESANRNTTAQDHSVANLWSVFNKWMNGVQNDSGTFIKNSGMSYNRGNQLGQVQNNWTITNNP